MMIINLLFSSILLFSYKSSIFALESTTIKNPTSFSSDSTLAPPLPETAEKWVRQRRHPPYAIIKHYIRTVKPSKQRRRIKWPKIKYAPPKFTYSAPMTFYKPMTLSKHHYSNTFDDFQNLKFDTSDLELPPSSYEAQSMDLDFYSDGGKQSKVPRIEYSFPSENESPSYSYRSHSSKDTSVTRAPHQKYGIPKDYDYATNFKNSGSEHISSPHASFESDKGLGGAQYSTGSEHLYAQPPENSFESVSSFDNSYHNQPSYDAPENPSDKYEISHVPPIEQSYEPPSSEHEKFQSYEKKPSDYGFQSNKHSFGEPPSPPKTDIEISYSPSYEINLPPTISDNTYKEKPGHFAEPPVYTPPEKPSSYQPESPTSYQSEHSSSYIPPSGQGHQPPSAPEHQPPAYQPPISQEHQPPSAPGHQPAIPSEYQPPSAPEHRPANKPRHHQPSSPGHQPPSAPAYQPPSAPGHRSPSPPRYHRPSSPGHPQPSSPDYQPPSGPGRHRPSSPVYQAPSAPGHQPPSAPAHQPPSTPGHQPPSGPGHQPPSAPGHQPPGPPSHPEQQFTSETTHLQSFFEQEDVPSSQELPLTPNHKQPPYDFPKSSYEVPIYDPVPFDASNREQEFYPPQPFDDVSAENNEDHQPHVGSATTEQKKVTASNKKPSEDTSAEEFDVDARSSSTSKRPKYTRARKIPRGGGVHPPTLAPIKHILDVPELEMAFEAGKRKTLNRYNSDDTDTNESSKMHNYVTSTMKTTLSTENFFSNSWNPMRIRTSSRILSPVQQQQSTASISTTTRFKPSTGGYSIYNNRSRQRQSEQSKNRDISLYSPPSVGRTREAVGTLKHIDIIAIDKSQSHSYYDGTLAPPTSHPIPTTYKNSSTRFKMPTVMISQSLPTQRTTKSVFDTTHFKSPVLKSSVNDKNDKSKSVGLGQNLPKNHKLY